MALKSFSSLRSPDTIKSIDDRLLLFFVVKRINEELVLLEEIALEVSNQLLPTGMSEFSLAFHLTVTQLTSVFMSLWPCEDTLALHDIPIKLTLESTAVREYC